MNRTLLLAVIGIVALSGCSHEAPPPRTSIVADTSGGPPNAAGMAHGDHNPHFGGVVLMNGTLHFEVVATEEGYYQLYFSDEARQDLPASIVQNVKLGVIRPGFRAEPVEMKISSTGESWEGKGGTVREADTTLLISYDYQGERRSSDMPFIAKNAQSAGTQKGATPHP